MLYHHTRVRVVLLCTLCGPLAAVAAAADYSPPDYYVSANADPYYATTAVTIVYSPSNLSDDSAPATTVAFSMALASDPSQTWVLGQADVPTLDPWQYVTQTVTFPLPAGSPVGTTEMRLIANINPTQGNGEVNLDNNITTTGFGIELTTPLPPPDSTGTVTTSPTPPPPPSDSTVTLSAPPAPSPPPPPSDPTSTAGTFLTDTSSLPVPTLTRPTLHAPFIDPVFGTTITRATDPSMAPPAADNPAQGLRHEYARYPALNADNTKVVVQNLGGADAGFFEVRDLASGTLLHRRIHPPGVAEEMSWHPTDPSRLFFRYNTEIDVFHTDTGQRETLMAFPQYYAIGTGQEGRPSDDWRYYAFMGFRDSSFSQADIVVVDLEARQVVATWFDSGVPNWVGMSPSGKYVVAQWTEGQGTRLYDRDTLTYIHTVCNHNPHSDFALDANGDEVLVYHVTEQNQLDELGITDPNTSPIAMARLSDGKRTKLLDLGWNWFTPHFSGIASRQHPGWVLVSTYTDPQTAQNPFAREIFLLKLDGSGQVRRLAHHHSEQGNDSWGDKDYWAEPHATSSWDGSTILFASVWEQPFSEYDLYTVTGQWW